MGRILLPIDRQQQQSSSSPSALAISLFTIAKRLHGVEKYYIILEKH